MALMQSRSQKANTTDTGSEIRGMVGKETGN